jgi:hypothetical protein
MKKKNRPPSHDIDQLLVQAVVLLQRQHLLAESLVVSGSVILTRFEQALAEASQNIENVIEVFNYCWALVDQLERYRKIASGIPKLNQRGAEFRALEAALLPLKNIRNQFQHINNHIRNTNSGPLLGSVCWINGTEQFIASLPDIGEPRSIPSLYLDTQTGAFAQQFCYIYNDEYYDLGAALGGMRKFQKYIDMACQIEVDGKPFVQRDHFIAMRVVFKLGDVKGS